MAFKFPSWNKPTLNIGLDFGSDGVKLICLLSSSKGYKLVAHALLPKDQLHELKIFLKQPDLKQSDLRVAISDPNIKIQKLTLPNVPKDEQQQMITWALKDALNLPVEDYVVRFHPCLQSSKNETQEFIAFAIENKTLTEWRKFISETGINEPTSAEPDIQSLTNLVSFNKILKDGERYAIIDVGKSQSQMAIISMNGIEFYRPFSGVSGETLIQNLSHDLGISTKDAEGLLLTYSNIGTCKNQEAVSEAISGFAAKFCVQAQYAIENYLVLQKDKPVTNILLSGGGANLRGLKDQIQETLHFPTDLIDPFSRIDLGKFPEDSFENFKTLYSVAAGLAL